MAVQLFVRQKGEKAWAADPEVFLSVLFHVRAVFPQQLPRQAVLVQLQPRDERGVSCWGQKVFKLVLTLREVATAARLLALFMSFKTFSLYLLHVHKYKAACYIVYSISVLTTTELI